jgi:hypothetical protein
MVCARCIFKLTRPLKVIDTTVGDRDTRVADHRDAIGVISRIERHRVCGIDGRRRLVCRTLKGAIGGVDVPAALDTKQGAKHRGHLPEVDIERTIGLVEISALVLLWWIPQIWRCRSLKFLLDGHDLCQH